MYLIRLLKYGLGIILFLLLLIGISSWLAAGYLVAAQPSVIPDPPVNLHAISVSIPTNDSQFIKGWWLQDKLDTPTILLLHGIRSNRLSMITHAKALYERGYSVLLIDLQAHGESSGQMITLGWLESVGVAAARHWIYQQKPGQKIGVIGVSLGGASILLGRMPCKFDAVVLESVYSNIHQAIENRLAIRFGRLAPLITPLLEMQLEPRVGIEPDWLNPADHIANLGAPVLIVAGGRDLHTHLDESKLMYENALEPKSIWIIPNASHQDFYALNPKAYEENVIMFLDHYLKKSN